MIADRSAIHGMMAEFNTAEALVAAVRKTRSDGWLKMDCYTPYAVEEVSVAMGPMRSPLPLLAVLGAAVGLVLMVALEYETTVWAYPMNIGGRPLNSWPAFAVPAFEAMILAAGVAVFVGLLVVNRLPEYYHPVFNLHEFRIGAKSESFYLCLEACDERFELASTRAYLEQFNPASIEEVEL